MKERNIINNLSIPDGSEIEYGLAQINREYLCNYFFNTLKKELSLLKIEEITTLHSGSFISDKYVTMKNGDYSVSCVSENNIIYFRQADMYRNNHLKVSPHVFLLEDYLRDTRLLCYRFDSEEKRVCFILDDIKAYNRFVIDKVEEAINNDYINTKHLCYYLDKISFGPDYDNHFNQNNLKFGFNIPLVLFHYSKQEREEDAISI